MKKNMSTTKKPQKEENDLLNEEIVEALILKYGISQKIFIYTTVQFNLQENMNGFLLKMNGNL